MLKRKKLKQTAFELLFSILKETPFTYILLSLFTAVLVFVLVNLISPQKDILNNDTIKIVILIATLSLGVLPALIKFLYEDKDKKKDRITIALKRQEFYERQKTFDDNVKEAIQRNPEVLNVEKAVHDKIISSLESSMVTKLYDRFKKNLETEFISETIITELTPLTKNIEKYIDKIQRNSIVNLVIGIIGTIAAITILAFAIASNNKFADLTAFFIHFLPRFTFVVFIQLFAFFFLRLYKNNLEDAKYFQNELTNLVAKTSAIKIAYITKKDEKFTDLLKDLSTTERNFKLQKEETTIGLEKAKIENETDKNIMEQLKDLLSKYSTK